MMTAEEYKKLVVDRVREQIEKYSNDKINRIWGDVERCLVAGEKSSQITFLHRYGKPDEIIKYFNEVGITFAPIQGSGYDDEYTNYTMDISVLYNKESQ